ncbi:MAG: threonine synthase [Bacteroidetes bacterium HGW-Bacteroidetes-16]|jgi:threonine synthase|nr:MAG: threonine synthase [Bacteroidetes bacterium HGW-Bacteroidetes-16]
MMHQEITYSCTTCGQVFSAADVRYLCPVCAEDNDPLQPPLGVLKVIYPYAELKSQGIGFKQLKEREFLDLLPIANCENLPPLKIGKTPLYRVRSIRHDTIPFELYLKDDSQNPTYSFKDRASAMVSAFAKEHEIDTIVTASTGNAGSSLAGICASQGQKAYVIVPESAPIAKLTQIIMYGATLIPVKGTYDDAFDLSVSATREMGWYNRNTAYNPMTIEGKKSVSFELFEELGEVVPDAVFVPVGDGVIISGVYKGFEDLLKTGIIDHMPMVVAVQAEGSANLVNNLEGVGFTIRPSRTLADSISVDIPRNFHMARQFLDLYNGEWLTVSDIEILNASALLAKSYGLFVEPAAAAAMAGLLKYHDQELVSPGSKNVVLLTGSGLKDLSAVKPLLNMPKAIEPTLSELKYLLK